MGYEARVRRAQLVHQLPARPAPGLSALGYVLALYHIKPKPQLRGELAIGWALWGAQLTYTAPRQQRSGATCLPRLHAERGTRRMRRLAQGMAILACQRRTAISYQRNKTPAQGPGTRSWGYKGSSFDRWRACGAPLPYARWPAQGRQGRTSPGAGRPASAAARRRRA